MYANSYGHPSPQPGLSNNPFVEDPTTAHARFPDLNANTFSGYPNQPPQYQPQYQPQVYATSAPYQSQPQTITPQSQFQSTSYVPQFQGQLGPQPTGFPQQQHSQYTIPSGYPLSYSSTSFTQQTNATPNYLAEFDPYAQSQPQALSQPQLRSQHTQIPGGGGAAPLGVSHPRDLIRVHKSGLEAWDTYSWKQLFSACDALKDAWSARKQQAESVVRQYGGASDPGLFGPDPTFGYNSQVEGWKQVLKDANDHFDIVAACTFQLHEVFNSYRQSGDPASKRRVRESCNAAVKGLPDWPSN